VQVIRCGLEAGYGSDSPPATQQRHRLLCIGRLSKEKGQLLLIGAAKLLAEAGVDFEIVLAGDGPMRGEVEALIAQLQLSSRIQVAGWLDSAGIEQQLRQARALVVPSLSEGLPVVLMEAMASGRPVIAPYLAGIPELVKDRRNGWLFPAGDTSALVSAMQACLLIGDDELLRMADAARADVWQAHDIDTEAAKLADLFRHSAALARATSLPRARPDS
jgi:glycosyltransferase involved in cell wall biosynthesis